MWKRMIESSNKLYGDKINEQQIARMVDKYEL